MQVKCFCSSVSARFRIFLRVTMICEKSFWHQCFSVYICNSFHTHEDIIRRRAVFLWCSPLRLSFSLWWCMSFHACADSCLPVAPVATMCSHCHKFQFALLLWKHKRMKQGEHVTAWCHLKGQLCCALKLEKGQGWFKFVRYAHCPIDLREVERSQQEYEFIFKQCMLACCIHTVWGLEPK